MAIAGRVAPLPKGIWDSSEEYSKLDIVSYQGCAYMARKLNTNRKPTENPEQWMLLADSGSPMTGATETEDGVGGWVPDPVAGDNERVLFGDGTFRDVKSSSLFIDDGDYVSIDYEILKKGE